MTTLLTVDQLSLPPNIDLPSHDQDPFTSPSASSTHLRFSHFDNHSLTFSQAASPDQAKRALTAHLAETERRIEEASRLGTSLLQQRKDLAERLDEVEQQQADDEISPELRKKLVEIEKEYNEVGRDSARAFLPKPRISSKDVGGSPFGDSKRSISPIKEQYETMGVGSPSKLGMKNRRQRNQPLNRVHDIEFATEISTSLLSQVRHLQALLAEKEEEFKTVALEKSRLEVEAESFTERLRSLNESGERYKDENWSLETQIHEFMAKEKEAADRERRLVQNLNVLQAEKSAAQKELDEVKSNHAKLSEEYLSVSKHYEVDLANLRRNLTSCETEKGVFQRKVEELRSQNQELVKAIVNQRGRFDDRDQNEGLGDEDLEVPLDDLTPEHSPPSSPVKGTPRHGMLESETLKSSLTHAHRMIQNLKTHNHRERTEKLELKRLLQDARDELELRREDIGASNAKKSRKVEAKEHKKTLKLSHLGGMRSTKSEIYHDDPNWEDDNGQISPSHAAAKAARIVSKGVALAGFSTSGAALTTPSESSDQFETANENEKSDAFESAAERIKDSDDMEGVEDISDALTEKEARLTRMRQPRTSFSSPANRLSFQSTASTSDEDPYNESQSTFSVQSSRPRLKFGRNSNRRSRGASLEPQSHGSPASLANTSRNTTPQTIGLSLFAELGELDGSDEGSIMETPIPSRHASRSTTPNSRPSTIKYTLPPPPPLPKISMIDTGMMTENWERTSQETQTISPISRETRSIGVAATENLPKVMLNQSSVATQITSTTSTVETADASSQCLVEDTSKSNEIDHKPITTHTHSETGTESSSEEEFLDRRIAKFPIPLASHAYSPKVKPDISYNSQQLNLSFSSILCENLEPVQSEKIEDVHPTDAQIEHLPPISGPLVFSAIQSLQTEPTELKKMSCQEDTFSISNLKFQNDASQSFVSPSLEIFNTSFILEKQMQPSNSVIKTENGDLQSHLDVTQHTQKLLTIKRQQSSSKLPTTDNSSQTALSAHQIDEMLKLKKKESATLDDGLGVRSSRVSLPTRGSLRPQSSTEKSEKGKQTGHLDSAFCATPGSRPASTGSMIAFTSNRSQYLIDQKQLTSIPAHQSGSPPEGAGSMGPPSLPISGQVSSKMTTSKTSNTLASRSSSVKDDTCFRRKYPSSATESRAPSRSKISRVSSVSSFASEVETRFQLRNGCEAPVESHTGTDPRMINAITQTMIGEYLWKYTRKTGRGAISERRHRRYFWVHPYTRTLYWSDRDPSTAGRAELKAKSVPIEAVRVVTDDNPMPPGLHRKSLIIMSPSRAVKFTAVTGQRHETWFNSLSYLLLRTEDDNVEDTSHDVKGPITHEDASEFDTEYDSNNPPASSTHGRTTQNDSYEKNLHVSGSRSSRISTGAFSRLSSYWRPGRDGIMESLSSRHSKHSIDNAESLIAINQAHDSAEDLREIIESQDRESDKLENVRACCDGRHDVGNLNSSIMSRHSRMAEVHSGCTRSESGAVRLETRAR
ncbi:Anucleate primary sterigmata protein A [Podosphaera aphanis]|nr:Anucleate primary sterigmata protein A [Podosphaera aphanis]